MYAPAIQPPAAVVPLIDLYWLAGLLEGEGSFAVIKNKHATGYPTISLGMTDRDVVERVAKMFGRAMFSYTPKDHRKVSYRVAIVGAPAAALMRTLQPLMGDRRRAKIGLILENYKPMTLEQTSASASHAARAGHAKRKNAKRLNESC